MIKKRTIIRGLVLIVVTASTMWALNYQPKVPCLDPSNKAEMATAPCQIKKGPDDKK